LLLEFQQPAIIAVDTETALTVVRNGAADYADKLAIAGR
jgi:hypothetical protein